MTENDFWQLIASINREALAHGNEDGAVAPLQSKLELLSTPELEAYAERLSQCLYALDGEAFARETGESGVSDDAFLYARCYVVAQGREHYQATLKNPKMMPKTLEQWCESLLYVHRHAWAKVTGEDESEWDFEPSVSYESGSNEELWPR